jgi:hypothetical protein
LPECAEALGLLVAEPESPDPLVALELVLVLPEAA